MPKRELNFSFLTKKKNEEDFAGSDKLALKGRDAELPQAAS